MRCALLQLNPKVGDIEANSQTILDAARQAADEGADLCITPELALIGYPPRDLLLFDSFIRRVHQAVNDLARALQELPGSPALILGTPGHNPSPRGKPLLNQALLLEKGRVAASYSKQLLPTYDVFDESRYFASGMAPLVINRDGMRIALTICEDIWNDNAFWATPHYGINPVERSAPFDILINISASPFTVGKQALREKMLSALARRYDAQVFYVNQVGGNDELVFDGRSTRFAPDGTRLARAAAFAEDILIFDTQDLSNTVMHIHPQHPSRPEPPYIHSVHRIDVACDDTPQNEIWHALVLGTRDYVYKSGLQSALVGLSGGVDSALVAAIACAALGADQVKGILMPSPWSSDHSLTDAHKLAANLHLPTLTIPIAPAMKAFDSMLEPSFAGTSPDVTEENIQARIRGITLMAQSNKFGALLLTTGNKSEISVGYCTIYGDMCGALAIISDLSKTEVYQLCRWLNNECGQIIPVHILTKAPSAELRPGQTDQDSLPPYDELDDILERMLLQRQSFAEICAAGHRAETVRKVAGLVSHAEFKRRQAAPGLKITEQAFGVGWRMPIACRTAYAD